jgi:hypothetical protein
MVDDRLYERSRKTDGPAKNEPQEPPHDILAAEEFAMPAPDPDLHHRDPVVLPEDPTGIAEPHDVLAAEEFPIPAVSRRPPAGRGRLGRRSAT